MVSRQQSHRSNSQSRKLTSQQVRRRTRLLAINHTASDSFSSAGYAPIHTNASYTGGQVRQHGNLSFSRVYQAGHEIPAYQPETAYEIFMRVLFNKDISTGAEDTGEGTDYSSQGPSDTLGFKSETFEQPLQFCYTLDPGSTCTEAQVESLLDGSATVCSWIVKDKNSTILFPELVGRWESRGVGLGRAGMALSGVGMGRLGLVVVDLLFHLKEGRVGGLRRRWVLLCLACWGS